MKQITTIFFLLIISTSLSFSIVASAAPVIWNDNGHYYDVVEDSSILSWEDARDWASKQTYTDSSGQLYQGYLATITSLQEVNFLEALTFTKTTYLLGGYQTPGTDETTLAEKKADWHWITGEAWDFTDWRPSEPNNFFRWVGVTGAGQVENYLQYLPLSDDRGWNDVYTGTFTDSDGEHFFGSSNFIIEYEAVSDTESANLVSASELLIVTVDGKDVSLDWSAMPDAQSSTLYVALADYKGDIDVKTIGSVNMGKKVSLYVPDLPSGLIIYCAVVNHTSKGDVISNIEKFMPFGGTVSFPESGNVIMTVNDMGGVGNFSFIGTRNSDGSIASITQIFGDNGSGTYTLNIRNDKPVSYIKGEVTVNFIYDNDGSVSFTTTTARSSINRSNDAIDCNLSRDENYKKLYSFGKISYIVSVEAKKQGFPVEMYKSLFKVYSLALANVKTSKDIDEFINSKLAAYLALLDLALEGVVDSMLDEYDEQCIDTPAPPLSPVTPTEIAMAEIDFDFNCPIPEGATYNEMHRDIPIIMDGLLEFYVDSNNKIVGPKKTWGMNEDGSLYPYLKQCYNSESSKHGWQLRFLQNGQIYYADYFFDDFSLHYQFHQNGILKKYSQYEDFHLTLQIFYLEDGTLSNECIGAECQ
ncbi:MAG: hypothetical protein KZQ83_20125 [gamma proteobacterium symbiont of Taylorina sp.]|nr:hypothetical protein [gamma proteobacterium symbiont of Taylorina sp.]